MAHLSGLDMARRTAGVAKKGWISKAIKHPGIEKERAKEHGISTHEQLERDSHSSSPKLRARGNLGLRFQKGGDLHHFKKPGKHKSRREAMYDHPKGD